MVITKTYSRLFAYSFITLQLIIPVVLIFLGKQSNSILKLITNADTGILTLTIGIISITIAGLILIYRKFPNIIHTHYPVYFFLFIFFLFYAGIGYIRHITLNSSLFDYGLQEQVIWNTAHGRFFASSPETNNFLGDHFSPLLLFVSAVYFILPYAITLFTIQALAITTGLLGFYRLALAKTGTKKLAAIFTFTLANFWPIGGLLLFDFHEIALAFPLLIWGIYWIETGKIKSGLALLALSVFAKEDVGMFVGALGVYYLFTKRKKIGAFMGVYGFLISFISLFLIIPHFRGEASDTLQRYAELGDKPSEIIKTILTKPVFMIKYLLKEDKIGYIVKIFLPVFPFAFLAPIALLSVVPNFAINILAASEAQNSAQAHYDVMITVAVFFSAVIGFTKLINYSKKYSLISKKEIIKFSILILISANLWLITSHPLWDKLLEINDRRADHQNLIDIKKSLPENDSFWVSNHAGAHFGDREKVYVFDPVWLAYPEQYDHIIIDKKTCCSKEGQTQLDTLLSSNTYHFKAKQGNIYLYDKVK